jgi:hypothetical protein
MVVLDITIATHNKIPIRIRVLFLIIFPPNLNYSKKMPKFLISTAISGSYHDNAEIDNKKIFKLIPSYLKCRVEGLAWGRLALANMEPITPKNHP